MNKVTEPLSIQPGRLTRTKIIATIGPSSRNYQTITALGQAGMDVARMNFSHSTHDDHLETIGFVRKFNNKNNHQVALLGDLQGPKLRIGNVLNNEIFLESGKSILLTSEECLSTPEKLCIRYNHLTEDALPGERILLDDGKLTLKVLGKKDSLVEAEIIHGGKLTSRKGVNFPDTKLNVQALSEKDRKDLAFALSNNVEWIALSFVRNADDLLQLREIIKKHKPLTKIIAKIEKPEAVTNIDDIIAVSDAIMVARGDLGVELEMEKVPILQKQIVKASIQAAKPVIIATQMMESMIQSPTPTRAETNDVTNAVLDGADAVMLSAETSSGAYPIEVVQTMQRIIDYAEQQDAIFNKRKIVNANSASWLVDEVCHQACLISDQLHAKAIVSMTHSGSTAFQLASFRPRAPIYIFTDNPPLLNTFSLIWGVKGLYYNKFATTDESIKDVNDILKEIGIVQTGDVVINTASMPLHERSRTNTIRVSVID